MQARVIHEPHIDERTDREIKRGLCVCFPEDEAVYSKTRGWNGYDPAITVVVESEGDVVAHASVIDKVIRVGTHEVRAAGVMNVYVLPGYRGRGLVSTAVSAGMDEALGQGYDLGLLFCKSQLSSLYEGAGWLPINDRLITKVVEGREQSMRENIVSLYVPLGLQTLPPGDIYLQGDEW
jgi:predicted N-acetyltransferase YhbS